MVRLNAAQLRSQEPDPEDIKKIKKNPIWIILDNVYDTYNIGAIFRLADAVAATGILLCGQTETPPNPRIKKASISTWKWVDWQYCDSAKIGIETLKSKIINLKIIVLEQDRRSIPLANFKPEFPLAIVVGNETYGVSPEVLKMADEIIELPMFGINKSLNVMVTCGIVLYKIAEFL